jgi:hypothetical protein
MHRAYYAPRHTEGAPGLWRSLAGAVWRVPRILDEGDTRNSAEARRRSAWLVGGDDLAPPPLILVGPDLSSVKRAPELGQLNELFSDALKRDTRSPLRRRVDLALERASPASHRLLIELPPRLVDLRPDRGHIDHDRRLVLRVIADREHVPDPAAQGTDVRHVDLLSQLGLRAVRKVNLEYELESGKAPVSEVYALAFGHNRVGVRTFAQQLLPVSRQMQERCSRLLVRTVPAQPVT